MKKATILELECETRKILDLVEAGETVQLTRDNQPVAILSPARLPRPDFVGRLQETNGNRMLATTFSEMIGEERGER